MAIIQPRIGSRFEPIRGLEAPAPRLDESRMGLAMEPLDDSEAFGERPPPARSPLRASHHQPPPVSELVPEPPGPRDDRPRAQPPTTADAPSIAAAPRREVAVTASAPTARRPFGPPLAPRDEVAKENERPEIEARPHRDAPVVMAPRAVEVVATPRPPTSTLDTGRERATIVAAPPAIGQPPPLTLTPRAATPAEPARSHAAPVDTRRAVVAETRLAPPLAIAAARPAPPPAIHVSIGRIEIRAQSPSATPETRSRPKPSVMALDEYLRQRQGGRS
jgi:hypothetical protein